MNSARQPLQFVNTPINQTSLNGKRQLTRTPSNFENLNSNSSYLSLKPSQKSIGRHQIRQKQTEKRSLSPSPSTYIQPRNPHLHHQHPTVDQTQNCFQFIPTNKIIQNVEFNHEQENSTGYGILQNPFPNLQPCKVNYSNLGNIGKSWFKFEGCFVGGLKEGPGTIYLVNGNLFTGVFSKDLANGKGAVYENGELVLKGTWNNNILITQF